MFRTVPRNSTSEKFAVEVNFAGGMHESYFERKTAKMYVGHGEELFCDIKLDSKELPREILLQWFDDSWEHRAYWGENLIDYGENGSTSRHYMGPIPSTTNQWVTLKIPASYVGLEGAYVNGMAFTLYDGKATWGDVGVTAP